VYRRFRNRRDIVRALVRRTQLEVGRVLEPCPTVEKAVAAYLEYGLSHPHEYELFYQHLQELTDPARPGRGASVKDLRPNFAMMERKLAAEIGGAPEDHRRLGLALWAMAHGTASLLLLRAVPPGEEAALRSGFTAAVGTLVRGTARPGNQKT
jgi:AcrR family transcriptional regulator